MAKKIYVLKEEENSGCCNLVIWDFLLIAFVAGYVVREMFHLHIVFCIAIGVVAGVVMISLMLFIEKLSKIIQLVFSLFWTMVICTTLESFIEMDLITVWAVRIVLFLFVTMLHFVSVLEMLENNDYDMATVHDSKAKKAEKVRQDVVQSSLGVAYDSLQKRCEALTSTYIESGDERKNVMEQASKLLWAGRGGSRLKQLMEENNTLWQEGSSCLSIYVQMMSKPETVDKQISRLEDAEELLQRMQNSTKEVMKEVFRVLQEEEDASTEKAESDEFLFAGCNSKESLQRRYKSLMKTFHPDNADGDESMTVRISAIYEELLKRYR